MSVEVAPAIVLSAARARLADFRELAKPRITLMVVLTALAGFLLGTRGGPEPWLLAATLLGTALSCAGAGALNMVLEHPTDALMRRTAARPIPAGRMRPWEALLFALALCAAGVGVLFLWVNPLTAVASLVCIGSYAFVYTPLKPRLRLAILVGAVPGAIPPVMGWTAATGQLGAGAAAVFAILFFWQVPHFLAIDWLYREDYRRAGFPTFAVVDPAGRSTALGSVVHGLLLLPVSAAPYMLGLAGRVYLAGAIVLGLVYLGGSIVLGVERSDRSARRLLLASVLYLPLLLALLVLDRS